jgi:hypothetical protein
MPEQKTKPFGGSICLTTRSFLLISPLAAAPAAVLFSASQQAAALAVAQYSASPLVAELVEAQCSANQQAAALAACTKPRIYKFGN